MAGCYPGLDHSPKHSWILGMRGDRRSDFAMQRAGHQASLPDLWNAIVGCIDNSPRDAVAQAGRGLDNVVQRLTVNSVGQATNILKKERLGEHVAQHSQIAAHRLSGNWIV